MEVESSFEAALTQRGVPFEVQSDGSYRVEVRGMHLSVSLENLRRDYGRARDDRIVEAFVETMLVAPGRRPDWTAARSQVRLVLEPSDQEFYSSVRMAVTKQTVLIAALVPADESLIDWIAESDLERWGVTREEVISTARENMASLLEDVPLDVTMVAGKRLAMLDTSSPLKASLIASPNLRGHVEAKLGWPILAVAPARDFVYLLAADFEDDLGRLGAVVTREYNESAYPVSTEVFRVSDSGIEAIGAFAAPD